MSHPNPYLFQISRMIMQVRSQMDIFSKSSFVPLHDVMGIKDVFFMYGRDVLFHCCTNVIGVYNIHSKFFFL
jgi:hypothetical protein